MKQTDISSFLAFVFFIALITIDWLYILIIQADAEMISHWVIALPTAIPLVFAMTLLSLIGIYIDNIWGFILAYSIILLSMYFAFISYNFLDFPVFADDIQFIMLILLNIIIFIYITCYHLLIHKNNK